MIRIVTAARLRKLSAAVEHAQASARQVQEQADCALWGHVHAELELAERAESAERAAAVIREEVAALEAALKEAQADLAAREERIDLLFRELEAARQEGRSLVLLLHYGEPHSIHRSQQAVQDYAATLGVSRTSWVSRTDRPASEVVWRMIYFAARRGSNDYLAV